MTHNIAIVDDHSLFADGLERILQDQKDIEVVAKCRSAEEFNIKLNQIIPHLVLLDIRMKGQNGLDLCKALKEKLPHIKIILISMFESSDIIEQAREAGAEGYLPKSTHAHLVKSSIKEVLMGHKVFLKPSPSAFGNQIDVLSKREKEIIRLIKKGMSANEISNQLYISQYTVETHRKNIMQKLGVGSQRELIVYAFENHL